MSQQQRVKKPIWKRWWLWVIVGLLVIAMISGGNGNDEEVADEPEEQVEVVEEAEEDTSADEAKVYDGAYKFAGEAVVDVEGSNIRIDTSVSADDDGNTFTDITVTEGLTDFNENVFTPGIYEFQFVEFPEQTGQGSWYVYINDDIKISGNPNASDAGKEYELKEGDIVSVDFWTIATFYKVVK